MKYRRRTRVEGEVWSHSVIRREGVLRSSTLLVPPEMDIIVEVGEVEGARWL